MDNLTEKRTGFDSLYKATYEHGWELKHTGYDYSENFMSKMLSSYMFRNVRLNEFILKHLSPIMVLYINKVKFLRIYFNFAVPKDYQKIN